MKKTSLIAITLGIFLLSNTDSYSQTAAPAPSSSGISSKIEEMSRFDYIISGLSTVTEATDIVAIFKDRPGIIDATADYNTHKISVYAPVGMPENDIKEVLKFAGKTIIPNEKLILKYYPN